MHDGESKTTEDEGDVLQKEVSLSRTASGGDGKEEETQAHRLPALGNNNSTDIILQERQFQEEDALAVEEFQPMPPTTTLARNQRLLLPQQTQPGAYRGAPGGALARTNNLCFSLVGAEAANASVLALRDSTRALSSVAFSRDTSGLVRANPVTQEDEADLEEAQPVVEDREKLGRRKTQQRNLRVMVAIAIGCVVVAVMSGATLGKRSKRNNRIARPTTGLLPRAPTNTPSSSPSQAPSGDLDGLVLQELPSYTLQALENPLSPQSRALEWLSNHPNVTNLPDWQTKELFAMVTLFYSLDGPNWHTEIKGAWLLHDPSPCFWFSSQDGSFHNGQLYQSPPTEDDACNIQGAIEAISLHHLSLGQIQKPFMPPELELLTALECINLSGNVGIQADLTEFLPIGHLPNLKHLDIRNNQFSGSIPSQLGLLTRMTQLQIGWNDLVGPLPSELGLLTNLTVLELDSCSIPEVPSELGQLTQLAVLGLEDNMLSFFPKPVFQMRSLHWLTLSRNRLMSTIPTQLALLSNLFSLRLESSALRGTIPSQLASLSYLGVLRLQNNMLSGSIPSHFSALTHFQDLHLSDNDLSGSIDVCVCVFLLSLCLGTRT